MNNENQLSMLAFTISSNKGQYALLLGSGISRAAGIPTGYEVYLDLIRTLASAYQEYREDMLDDELKPWYEQKFQVDPDYSRVLRNLGRTPTQRQNILRRYFEASEADLTDGKKVPTQAHKSIAHLVRKGYIKVIVTTNFDRLLETALRDEGIEPYIVSTQDGVKGMIPLAHITSEARQCLIVKINGDYLDSRILNTDEELSKYKPELNKLLKQIFDEFGLIIAGWSGVYDTALRSALMSCKNHRYSTYWLSRNNAKVEEDTNRLISHRKAEKIEMPSADAFFTQILEKIESIESFSSIHPLSDKILVETVKRYLAEDKYRIKLRDLIVNETESTFEAVYSDSQSPICIQEMSQNYPVDLAQIETLEKKLYRLSKTLLLVCFYGKEAYHYQLVTEAVQRMANPKWQGAGRSDRLNFRYYPALHLLYVCGLGYLATKNYTGFLQLISIKGPLGTNQIAAPLVERIMTETILGERTYQRQLFNNNLHTPMSDHLEDILFSQYFSELRIIPNKQSFEEIFDYFEYFKALLYVYSTQYRAFPSGRFIWRNKWNDADKPHISSLLKTELEDSQNSHPILAAGMFGGLLENLEQAIETVKNNMPSTF